METQDTAIEPLGDRADSGQLHHDNNRDSATTYRRRRNGASRLRTLDDLDQRTRAARLARELVADLESDLGGQQNLSTAKKQLVVRAALLGAMVGDTEARWLSNKPSDLTLYGTLVDRQRRCLEALGLERRARLISETEIERLIDVVERSPA